MPITKLMQETKKFEIQIYKKPKDFKSLRKTHIPFSGSPQKHPYDPEKVILITDPYSGNTIYYEFKTLDISYVEDMPNIVNFDGETIIMARIWVKKKSIGVRCSPFIVDDISDS